MRGTLGLFRFSYYEAFEEQLRPMEISATNDFAKPECIFPSQATVTNATYPLARQLLLTVNYRNMRDSDINEFLVQSLTRSQQIAEKRSLVPLPDETRDTELAWLERKLRAGHHLLRVRYCSRSEHIAASQRERRLSKSSFRRYLALNGGLRRSEIMITVFRRIATSLVLVGLGLSLAAMPAVSTAAQPKTEGSLRLAADQHQAEHA